MFEGRKSMISAIKSVKVIVWKCARSVRAYNLLKI
jgi:hypothetical protein